MSCVISLVEEIIIWLTILISLYKASSTIAVYLIKNTAIALEVVNKDYPCRYSKVHKF